MDVSRLKKTPLFEGTPDESLKKVAPFVEMTEVAEGKVLAAEGDFPHRLMIIDEGTAEVTREGKHLAELGPGDYFGEMSLIDRSPRVATVVAKSSMRLFAIDRSELKRMEQHMPEVVDRLKKAIEERRSAIESQ